MLLRFVVLCAMLGYRYRYRYRSPVICDRRRRVIFDNDIFIDQTVEDTTTRLQLLLRRLSRRTSVFTRPLYPAVLLHGVASSVHSFLRTFYRLYKYYTQLLRCLRLIVSLLAQAMGVDNGGTRGTSPPRIWSRGTLVQIVPLRFLSYRYKKERSVAFKIRQNPFSTGALHRTPLGELPTLPQAP